MIFVEAHSDVHDPSTLYSTGSRSQKKKGNSTMQISNIIGGGGNRDQYALSTFFKFRFVRYTPKEGDSMQTNYFRRCACDTAQLNHVQLIQCSSTIYRYSFK